MSDITIIVLLLGACTVALFVIYPLQNKLLNDEKGREALKMDQEHAYRSPASVAFCHYVDEFLERSGD